jgi:hypothetical protein
MVLRKDKVGIGNSGWSRSLTSKFFEYTVKIVILSGQRVGRWTLGPKCRVAGSEERHRCGIR